MSMLGRNIHDAFGQFNFVKNNLYINIIMRWFSIKQNVFKLCKIEYK